MGLFIQFKHYNMSSSLDTLAVYLRKYDPEKGDHPVRMVVEHMQVGMLRSMSEWLEAEIMPEIMNPDGVGSGIVSCLKSLMCYSRLVPQFLGHY